MCGEAEAASERVIMSEGRRDDAKASASASAAHPLCARPCLAAARSPPSLVLVLSLSGLFLARYLSETLSLTWPLFIKAHFGKIVAC